MLGSVWAGDVTADADVIGLSTGQGRERGAAASRRGVVWRLYTDQGNGFSHAIEASDDLVELVIDKPREEQPVDADCEG